MLSIKEIQTRQGVIENRYCLIDKIGGGGFSEVWLANDIITNLKVVLKIYIGVDGLNEDGKNMYLEEFRRQSVLNHSNILHVNHYDDKLSTTFRDGHVETLEIPYLELPYCSRGAASSLVGHLSDDELWRFAEEVASGLVYIHSRKPRPLVHQDIKPANILIGDDGTYFITDFGISVDLRATVRPGTEHPYTESLTPAYAGKERFQGIRPVMASDIWSLGATLYELATGDVPFGRNGGNHQKDVAEKRPPINGVKSAELKELIWACLAEETWERPSADTVMAWAKAKKRPKPKVSSSAWQKAAVISSAAAILAGVAVWWPIRDPPVNEFANDSLLIADVTKAHGIIEQQWHHPAKDDKDTAVACAQKMASTDSIYRKALSLDSVSEDSLDKAKQMLAASQTLIDEARTFYLQQQSYYSDIDAPEPAAKFAEAARILNNFNPKTNKEK